MTRTTPRTRPALLPALLLCGGVLSAGGCGDSRPTAAARNPWAGAVVTVWCADPVGRAEFTPRMTAWANRQAVSLKVVDRREDAEVVILPACDLGVVAGDLSPVPDAVVGDAGGFLWGGLLRVYQSDLVRWGPRPYAVPLTGEGYALVSRTDRLTDPAVRAAFAKKNREPLPIRTWEELAEVAAVVTQVSGQPPLPPLPESNPAALTAFGLPAACFDRAPVKLTTKVGDDGIDYYRRGLSFLVTAETGEPRLTAPAFRHAMKWYYDTRAFRPATPGDPLDALVNGTAVAAVLSVGQIRRLPIDPKTGAVDARFGVGEAPGSRLYFDGKDVPRAVATNFVPYYAGDGLVGGVRKSAAQPDACWGLLAELGGPAGSSTTLETPGLGGGPVRGDHVSGDARAWRHLRFDDARTAEVGRAMRHFAAVEAVNPAIGLRTPDRAAITDLIVKQLRRVAAGEVTPDDGVNQAAADWAAHDANTPAADRKAIRKRAAGAD